ncbi:Na+/H+ antiporter subunit E [Streptomyces zingiberis]|uniref:Na+/H+ antiporter subunit E n=1 Tax=Streptomyces zingiberis TaxID=2053010 RepID=A0ABX1BRP1_9ACTN|nr:Na+/H+ antiporter subunit E [Streptomyces zingiberis]NJQ00361.1 Na+/H+ antiporter subunit E [Streptomyces zingiberis]
MKGHATERRIRRHLPMVGWLWFLWLLLWGSVSPGVLLSGLAVALAVVVSFPLPPVMPRPVLRPWGVLRLVGCMLADLVGSAVTVAWQALRHGPSTPGAVVEVEVAADSDLLIAATATLATLTPGTLVLEIDRRGRLLYVHALPVRDAVTAEHRREEVRTAERHVYAAFGRDRAAERLRKARSRTTPKRKEP